jgi:hypothetical protein
MPKRPSISDFLSGFGSEIQANFVAAVVTGKRLSRRSGRKKVWPS